MMQCCNVYQHWTVYILNRTRMKCEIHFDQLELNLQHHIYLRCTSNPCPRMKQWLSIVILHISTSIVIRGSITVCIVGSLLIIQQFVINFYRSDDFCWCSGIAIAFLQLPQLSICDNWWCVANILSYNGKTATDWICNTIVTTTKASGTAE